jgi:hypothetical protein
MFMILSASALEEEGSHLFCDWDKIVIDLLQESHPFTVLLQAILFYVPRWLWKNWEAGKVAALRMDLNLGIISEVEKKLKKKLLIEYMYSNLKHHNFWAYRYFFCELLSLVNVCGMLNLILKTSIQFCRILRK